MALELPAGFDDFVNAEVRGEIKLKDFSNIFFPMFVAYFNGEEPQIGRWLTFTKTKGYEWVDVVDSSGTVFSVPPVLQNQSLTAGKGLTQDPAEIMVLAKLKDTTIPGAGNRHIRENITDRIDNAKDHETGTSEYRKAWGAIFAYYGYNEEPTTTNTSTATLDFNPEDFDSYDEL